MSSQAWLESSLQRSASLGLEVLERASRRSVAWSSTAASQGSTGTGGGSQIHTKRTHDQLHDAFAAIAEFMAQTTDQCKRFYECGCGSEPTDTERTHVSRFHTRPAAARTTPAPPIRMPGYVSAAGDDFHIEVSPGTYAVTASRPESQQHTRLVSVKAGESVSLTFNL